MDALGSGLVIRTLGLAAIIKKISQDTLSYLSLMRVQPYILIALNLKSLHEQIFYDIVRAYPEFTQYQSVLAECMLNAMHFEALPYFANSLLVLAFG